MKDKTPHPACKIYEGTCSCSANCIGETKGIVETRRNEQERIQIKILRSSHRKCSVKKGVLKNISKFTGKHLCQSLFFNTVCRPEVLHSEPAKHLRDFPDHKFDWKILLTAPKNTKLRKILESSIIALKIPTLIKWTARFWSINFI